MSINAERLFENAKEALRLACIDVHDGNVADGEGLYEIMTKDPDTYLAASAVYFRKAQPALEIYMMAKDELGKSKGGNAYSAMKRVIKSVPDARKNLKGVWLDVDGHQCACDGYRAVRLNKPLDGFDIVPGMELSKVYPNELDWNAALDLPTPGELKIYKKKLTTGAAVYDFGDGLPMVSAAYLKDIMDMLPDAKAYINPSKGATSMILFKSERGDGILLPVRKDAA